MSDSTTNLDLISAGQANKESIVNALLDAASPAMLYGRRAVSTAGLTWGYFGGVVSIGGTPTSIANGTVTLAASATNYIEANPADGTVSANTSGFTAGRTRLYVVITGASTATSYTDLRIVGSDGSAAASAAVAAHVQASDPHPQYLTQAEGDARYTASGAATGTVTSVSLTTPGVLFDVAGSPVTTTGTLAMSLKPQAANKVLAGPATGVDAAPTMRALVAADLAAILAAVNVFTKNQSVAPVSLGGGVSPAIDASLSNNFKITLTANNTLVNPTNLIEGMILNFAITQDGTGGRTLSYGSLYKFPGGTAPVLSTAAGARDFMSCYYDGAVLLCQLNKGFA